MVRVGIIGASGFTGAELMRLLAGHPEMELVVATADSNSGGRVADLHPSLAASWPHHVFEAFDAHEIGRLDLDVAFLGLPHEASLAVAPQLVGIVGCVVDLSAAFRLRDAAAYPQWYGFTHDQPDLLAEAVYGLPERTRHRLKGARLVATPGCYVTAATLALGPLVDAALIAPTGIIIDAASGVSGAGRAVGPTTAFCTVDENFTAYGLLDHRHTPEIEQNLGAQVLFTPHLAPMNRGILATCYARPVAGSDVSTESLLAELDQAYSTEPFVVVTSGSPATKATMGSNTAIVTVRYDERTGYIIALCAIDNLTKGASGGALQSANVALGLDETAGSRGSGWRREHVASTQHQRAATLVEALPYIRRFAGQTVVVKYGGNAIAGTSDHDALDVFAQDIVLMRLVGLSPVVVHGGGPQISSLMARLGKTAEFRDGLRVTDAETIDIARMVLVGQVNPQLVDAINVHGTFAVGVSGGDGGLLRATARHADLGFVGDVSAVNPAILTGLLAEEFIPVIATIGTDERGQAYNINADTVAGAIAEALGAAKLVYLTDIEGLRRDVDDPDSLIRQTTADELDEMVARGNIAGGMIPKVTSCSRAVRNGVGRAHILDGRVAHVLLLEIFTDDGVGTVIDAARQGAGAPPVPSKEATPERRVGNDE